MIRIETEAFIEGNGISGVNIKRIKKLISQNLDGTELSKEWLLREIEPFFYADNN